MKEINNTILLAAIELVKSGYRPLERQECIPLETKDDPRTIKVSYERMPHSPAVYRVIYDELYREFKLGLPE